MAVQHAHSVAVALEDVAGSLRVCVGYRQPFSTSVVS